MVQSKDRVTSSRPRKACVGLKLDEDEGALAGALGVHGILRGTSSRS